MGYEEKARYICDVCGKASDWQDTDVDGYPDGWSAVSVSVMRYAGKSASPNQSGKSGAVCSPECAYALLQDSVR